MTRLLPALLALAATPLAAQGLPQLAVEGKNLEILEALVSVEVEGRVAEIVYELAYQNDSNRRQEGEFSLQLPPDATVSTYAIDVLGVMRPAVSVEKERARNAYESIKRRQVDPGIVERQAGNVYRTRVFPLEPKSAKRVRIGYLRELNENGSLDLPLACEGRIGRFELTVRHPASTPGFKDLKLPGPERPDKDTWHWTADDFRLSGGLVLPPFPAGHRVESLRVEGPPGGTRHLVIQGELSPQDAALSEAWRKVRVIWDASYSGRFRDHAAELAALDQIWNWLGETEVTLQTLSTELSPPLKVSLSDDGARVLREALQKTRYDGSADYSKIHLSGDITLLVGDGIVSSPIWRPFGAATGPVFLIKSTEGPASPEVLSAVDVEIDPRREDFLTRLREHRSPPLIQGLPRHLWNFVRTGSRYRLTGIIPPEIPATLHFHGGGMPDREISTAPTHGTEEWNFTRRLWAQDRLSDLEGRRDRDGILAHSVAERLASDFTSLIVLERMEDHLRYRIPPPEPDLLTEYQRLLPAETLWTGNAFVAWNGKRHWYTTDFPWIDTELREEAATVAIFTKAARRIFEEPALKASTVPALEAWIPEATATAANAAKIESKAGYEAWQAEARARFGALRKIREDNAARSPNRSFGVSVRGFVKERGVYQGESPFELKDAVAKAGGPNTYGTLSRVFLYRDGQRTGYNLESRQATAVPLRPCDMIVVESLPPPAYLYLSADPFAAPAAGGDPLIDAHGPAAGGGAPVFETAGQAKPPTPRTPGTDPFGGGQRGTEEAAFIDGFAAPAATDADADFLAALRAAPDPAAFYREALDGPFGADPVAPATVVEAARFLYSKGNADLAWKVLTTLCELEPNPVEATRALAFWLAEFGQRDRAFNLLGALLAAVPDKATKALVEQDRARLAGERDLFVPAVTADLESGETKSLAPVLLTDLFTLGGRAPKAAADFRAQAMPSDLRLVVSCAGGRAILEIAAPGRPLFQVEDAFGTDDEAVWRFDHPRLLEYQVRRALPGTYAPSLVRESETGGPVTVRLDVYLRWGTKDEERRSVTLLMDQSRMDLPKIDFGWGD